jgi:predicted solute-binding protein
LLQGSRKRGVADLERLAREAAQRLHLPLAVCEQYLRLLDYDLEPRDLEGLRRFLEMAIPDFRWSSVRFVGDSE